MDKNEFVEQALREDPALKRSLVTKELEGYFKRFEKVSHKYKEFEAELSRLNKMPRQDVPKFVNLLMAAVLNNLSSVHQDIVNTNKTSSYSYGGINRLVATSKGIRMKYSYGHQSNDLTGNDILNVFGKHSADVESWIKAHKPDKLNDFLLMKSAFLKDFKSEYCTNDSRYDRNADDKKNYSNVEKDVPDFDTFFISEDAYHGYSVKMVPFVASKICLKYSIDQNSCKMYILSKSLGYKDSKDIIDGKGVIKFNDDDALQLIEMRSLLPIMENVLDDAARHRDIAAKEMNDWFSNLKLAMNKWVSIMGI